MRILFLLLAFATTGAAAREFGDLPPMNPPGAPSAREWQQQNEINRQREEIERMREQRERDERQRAFERNELPTYGNPYLRR